MGIWHLLKHVSAVAFGLHPAKQVYVALNVVPMGWSASVGIIQNLIRRYVFVECGVDGALGVHAGKECPQGDLAVTCMGGFDYISRFPGGPTGRTARLLAMQAFVYRAEEHGLPLNTNKEVVNSYNGMLLGGELDGVSVYLRHSRVKSHALNNKTLALLSMSQTPQAPLQHWADVKCFAAGYRRPMFCI